MTKYAENYNKIKDYNNYKNIADKIITNLKNIKNDPNISSRRWVWELMQNATDVKYEKEKISIEIILDDEKLVFKHNGKYFRTNDILSLLQQVSSKNSQNLEGQTGKFGTGFIGTHLLSDIIYVKGIISLTDKDFREFEISLDRSEQVPEKLVKNIKESIELFEKIEENPKIFKKKPNYLKNRKETDFDTSFTYHLNDEEKKESAINGINDLTDTMPISLITQNQKIKQVTIYNNIKKEKITYIPKLEGKEQKNDITESSVVMIINKQNFECSVEFNFLSYLKVDKKKEKLRLITEIIKKEGKIFLNKITNKPMLYRNFPLIGSNEFNMPFIVDGFDFYPLESRNGIFLNAGKNDKNLDTQKNMSLLNEAFDASIEFIKCMLKKYKYLERRFFLASSKLPKPIVTFDSYAKNWIEERQRLFREKLKDLPLLKFDNQYYNLSQLLLPIFNEKYNKEFYDVVSILNIRKKILPQKENYRDWYNIIVEENNEIQGINIKNNPLINSWGMTKNEENGEIEINYIYDEIDLLKDLKNCKNLNTLSKKLNKNIEDTINSLNIFLQFLKKFCKYDEILNKYPIIPNRNGDFKKIEKLYSDDENIIPKEVMDIYDSISKTKLKDELIDSRINIDNLGDLLKRKKFDSISDYLNNYILKNNNIEETKKLVVYPLLSIKSDIKQVSIIYKILTLFYNLEEKNILNNNNKTTIPIYFWTIALKFWFNEHPKEIEKYKNIIGLRNNLINKNIDNIEILKWMNFYLDFLKANSQDRNFENLKIFPNQNGDFCPLHSLYSDSGFPEEFKDILKKHFNIDKRKILLDKQILTYKDNKTMHETDITKEIKNEFNQLLENNKNYEKLEDIAFDILCLYPENKEKKEIRKYIEAIIIPKRTDKELKSNTIDPIEYLGFAEVVYNRKDKFLIKYINTETLDYIIFINYIIERICDKIEKAGNVENITNIFYGIKTINDLENFIIKLVKFIWDSQNTDYPIKSCIDSDNSKKKVFLNMQNHLVSIDQVNLKIDFKYKEKEKIILDLCLNKHINIDYRKDLLNENLNKSLYGYKNKFSKFYFSTICRKIDDAIMNYDQNKDNQGKQYDNDFFELNKTVKNLKLEKELMKKLFPYFSANKSRIIISCLDEEKVDPLIDMICEGTIDNLFSKNNDKSNNKDNIENILKEDKKNNTPSDNFNGNNNKGEKFIVKDHVGFKMKQKFNFEIINLDNKKKENPIHKETLPINDLKILFNNDIMYNQTLDFKIIIPENVTKEKNYKDIKIEYKQNKDNCIEFCH